MHVLLDILAVCVLYSEEGGAEEEKLASECERFFSVLQAATAAGRADRRSGETNGGIAAGCCFAGESVAKCCPKAFGGR